MADLDGDKIKKLKRGEAVGYAFAAVCVVAVIYFIVCFSVAQVNGYKTLRLVTLVSAPLTIAVGASGSAYFNLVYGAKTDRLISEYIRDVFVENAAAMHPERKSLTFYFSFEKNVLTMKTNGYSEKIVFDFSCFKSLSPLRASGITSECVNRLTDTFCRLYERGADYVEVGYVFDRGGGKKRESKIISGGIPDRRAYREYVKRK